MQLDETDRRVLRHYLADPDLPRADLADRDLVGSLLAERRSAAQAEDAAG